MGTDDGIDDATDGGIGGIGGIDDPPDGGTDDPSDELARLRQERDQLAARLSNVDRRRARGRRLRAVAVGVLVALGCTTFTLAAVGIWVRRNVTDTDRWVDRAGSLAEDPAVQAALGRWMSDEVIALVDPETLFVEVLPERGRLLAGPLAGAVEDFIRERIDGFLASDEFASLWVAANERAHRGVVRVLRGDAPNVEAGGESVTINLVPIIDEALSRISSASPELLGRQVSLPELSVDDLPAEAVDRLGDALGIELDDDFGQVTVYDEGRLEALQEGVDQARRLLVLVAVTAVVCLAGALALSARRRRTLLQIVAGLAIGIALVRRLAMRGEDELLASIDDQLNRNAAAAVTDSFVGPLLDVTRGLLLVLVALAIVAVLTGPYPRVVWLRARVAEGARRGGAVVRAQLARSTGGAGDADSGADSDGAAETWIDVHRGTLQIAGIVVGVLALVLLDLSFVGVLVLAAVVGLFELAVRPAGGVEGT